MKSFYQSTVNPAIKKLFGAMVLWQHLGMACRIHDCVVRGRQSAPAGWAWECPTWFQSKFGSVLCALCVLLWLN